MTFTSNSPFYGNSRVNLLATVEVDQSQYITRAVDNYMADNDVHHKKNIDRDVLQ